MKIIDERAKTKKKQQRQKRRGGSYSERVSAKRFFFAFK